MLDSLDQHAMGLDCAAVTFSGDELGFEVPVVKGTTPACFPLTEIR